MRDTLGGSIDIVTEDTTIKQLTQATVGGGEITIRDEASQEQDLAGLNRDVDQVQVITVSESDGVNIFASSDSVAIVTNQDAHH